MVIFRIFTIEFQIGVTSKMTTTTAAILHIRVVNLCRIVMGGSGRVLLCEPYVNDNYLTQLDLIKRLYRIPPNDVFDVAQKLMATQSSHDSRRPEAKRARDRAMASEYLI